ncbi:16933_t:CDS:2, partial [Racocetra fulgida]
MQAITFQQPFKVLVKTVPLPKIIQDTDVIVKISVCGLCGSDLHRNEVGIEKDTIMGHEFMGIVSEVGSSVNDFKVGDRVLSPFTTCCGEVQLFGWVENGYGLHGGQTEYIRVPLASSTLIKVPDEISDKTALLLGDVLSTGYFCAENGLNELAPQLSYLKQYKLDYQKKDEYDDVVVVVVGCGPVGLMSIASAIYLGVKNIFSVDSIQERLELAKDFGATPIHLIEDNPIERIKEITNGRVRRMLTKTIPFALSKKFNFEKIITHEMKLCDGEKAYEIFEKKLDKCVKTRSLNRIETL